MKTIERLIRFLSEGGTEAISLKTAVYGGLGTTIYSIMENINWTAVIGASVAIGGLAVNWYYTRKKANAYVKALERGIKVDEPKS